MLSIIKLNGSDDAARLPGRTLGYRRVTCQSPLRCEMLGYYKFHMENNGKFRLRAARRDQKCRLGPQAFRLPPGSISGVPEIAAGPLPRAFSAFPAKITV